MKKLITIIAIALSFVATAQKVGHVNIQKIMVALPEYKASSDELNRFAENKQKELEMYIKLYREEEAKFAEEAQMLTEEIKQQRYEELMISQQKIQAMQAEMEQQLIEKEQMLLKPIDEKVRGAIATVAKANGYKYVLEESMLMYFDDADSIDALVKKELGIE